MNTIHNIHNHSRLSTSLDKGQIESLGEKLDFLLDFVENHHSHEAEILESQIASLAHATEDVIESHIVDQIESLMPRSSTFDHEERSSRLLLDFLLNMMQLFENRPSRVVVTTRQSNVASHFGTLNLTLHFLDYDRSWDLFCEKAFEQVCCPSEIECIGRKIVKKCKGLPLSIVVIGGLLGKSSRTQEHWVNVEKDLSSILNTTEDNQCFNILSLSYTGGFLKPNKEPYLEKVAKGYIEDLVGRNLIVRSLSLNGKVKTCSIHNLLRDFCIKYWDENHPLSVCAQATGMARVCGGVVAPSEIWDMQQLRHLQINQVNLPEPPQSDKQDRIILQNLQTLRVAYLYKMSSEVCKRMPNIKKLRITFVDHLEGLDDTMVKSCFYNVGRLNKLESLYFDSTTGHGPSGLLQNLKLPVSLKKLCLRHCNLNWDDLTVIGSLPR
ncbi:hypothetical protein ACS0TY_006898 [Phlomoides rotata]